MKILIEDTAIILKYIILDYRLSKSLFCIFNFSISTKLVLNLTTTWRNLREMNKWGKVTRFFSRIFKNFTGSIACEVSIFYKVIIFAGFQLKELGVINKK